MHIAFSAYKYSRHRIGRNPQFRSELFEEPTEEQPGSLDLNLEHVSRLVEKYTVEFLASLSVIRKEFLLQQCTIHLTEASKYHKVMKQFYPEYHSGIVKVLQELMQHYI